jgi:elongation factor P
MIINYTEIKPGKILNMDDVPYVVTWTSGVVKKQRQKPHNTVKMRNLKTGTTTEHTFTQSEKVYAAELTVSEVRYLFTNPRSKEMMFTEPNNPSNRFALSEEVVGNTLSFILENSTVDAIIFDDEIISLKLPNKVNLKVAEAPPNTRGNTSAGGNKVVILETGLKITTPLFINTGDTIRINTETNKYSERI